MNIKNNKALWTVMITVIVLSAGCSGITNPATEASTTVESALADALPNMEYILESTTSGKAPLQDGYYEEPSAPDSAAMTKVQLSQQTFGDINQDGFEDAAVTLLVDSAGSGTFTYLALVINENGMAKPLPAVFLGDRIIVNSISIQSGVLTVNLLTREEGEPMSAEPTVDETLAFILEGEQIIPTEEIQ